MKLQQESAAHDSDKTSNTRGPRARPPRVDRLESKLHSLGVYKPASSTWTCHLWSLVPTRSASTDSTKFLAGVARLHGHPCTTLHTTLHAIAGRLTFQCSNTHVRRYLPALATAASEDPYGEKIRCI